jgi:hypothetical protein
MAVDGTAIKSQKSKDVFRLMRMTDRQKRAIALGEENNEQ